MRVFALAFLAIIIIAIISLILFALWRNLKNISSSMADIRHGKGVFLTFNYTPEEWEYYTQTLPFTGKTGKVRFARNHIYITDGTEEILYEVSGPTQLSARLREISSETDFITFTVRNKELSGNESGEVKPDSSDNLRQYQILIPKAQQTQTDELIGFYRKIIDKTDE